ncbi:MAG: rhomboid family intramembrane serine protease [Bacteroidales bacterium]|jgi:membrane associated rhomboid family serine protease|nr:rhomboid family intramembrane serine protease [Bacteroidales bacterium]
MNSDYQYSPRKFNTLPPVCKNMIIINIIVFFACWVLGTKNSINLEQYLGLHIYASSYHHVWQYITYSFVHANLSHLFLNMFAFWMFGAILENIWGAKKFVIYCLVAALGAAIAQQVTYYFVYKDLIDEITNIASSNVSFVNTGKDIISKSMYIEQATNILDNINTVGASGIVFGVLLAFGLMFPNNYIYLGFLVPIKAKWFVIGYVLIELYNGIVGTADGIAHFAHLGGALAGFILIMIWNKGVKHLFH